MIILNFEFILISYLQALKDKKLKGQLAVREDLHLRTAQAAAKAEKVSFEYVNLSSTYKNGVLESLILDSTLDFVIIVYRFMASIYDWS